MKLWNSLPDKTRRQVVKTVFHHMGESFQQEMMGPFKKKDTWNEIILSHCTLTKDNCIKITINVPIK